MADISFENMPVLLQEIYQKIERIESLLEKLTPGETKDLELMNVQEAAQYLKLTVPAIYTKVSRREIPANKPGRRLYFIKSELRNWAQGAKLKTQDELANEAEMKMKNYRKHLKF